MHIGLQQCFFNYTDQRTNVFKVARVAEDAGFYSYWTMDHFFQLGGEYLGPPEDPMLEAYTTLGYVAAVTDRMKLGTLVTGVIYRHPGALIKTVTTLDVLSGGRAYFGIGAGWFEREALALGLPFPDTTTRFAWLEETLQIAHQMWSEDVGPYRGEQFTLEETLSNPQPPAAPRRLWKQGQLTTERVARPPIMIGGMGESKTLRYVAQYADACNLFASAGIDVLRRKLDVLRGHCEAIGRDYNEIEKTALNSAFWDDLQSAQQVVDFCGQMAELGITHMIFNMRDTQTLAPLETFGRDIIPAVAAL